MDRISKYARLNTKVTLENIVFYIIRLTRRIREEELTISRYKLEDQEKMVAMQPCCRHGIR